MSDDQVKTTGGNERLQLWLNFVKFLLGTVALGVVTLMVNSEIQRQRLEFEIRSKENEFIAQFLDKALDEDLERRRDFAEYFVRLTPTEESRTRWVKYRDYAQSLVEESARQAGQIQARERELADLREALEAGQELADTQKRDLQKEIADMQDKLAIQRRELATIRSEPSTVVVPTLISLPQSYAEELLLQAGLRPTVITESTGWVEFGLVIRQRPYPGDRVKLGSSVKLYVSKGLLPEGPEAQQQRPQQQRLQMEGPQ